MDPWGDSLERKSLLPFRTSERLRHSPDGITFPDPTASQIIEPRRISHDLAYSQDLITNIVTLSSSVADRTGSVSGLLYVPDLDPSDPCYVDNPFVPLNATKQANLPDNDYNLIAIAPWFDNNCTLKYLESTQSDPIHAFVFYLPDNGTSIPPAVNSDVWNLGDGGAWKIAAHYPVYAIPGFIGSQMMQAICEYSGNVTKVPNGRQLIELGVYPSDYVRVYTTIGVTTTFNLPSIWIYILIVFGVLLCILAVTCGTLYSLQRQKRRQLQHRIVSGEADLEVMGICRLTVPVEKIEDMPRFIYAYHGAEEFDDRNKQLVAKEGAFRRMSSSFSDASTKYPSTHNTPSSKGRSFSQSTYVQEDDTTPAYIQPTCLICLNNFKATISVIRELPCGHIYHPECIDPYLTECSSLCPTCKKSTLPHGYCPVRITNTMVRKERLLRRAKSRVVVRNDEIVEQYRRTRLSNGERAMMQLPQRTRSLEQWNFEGMEVAACDFSDHHELIE